MNHATAKEAIQFERQLRENKLPGRDSNPYLVKKGKIHFVVSAPHAAVHYRNTKERLEKRLNEPYTGALALQLHDRTDASVIIFDRTAYEDPNWDKTSLYKTKLKGLVQDASLPAYFVLDLHGMSKDVEKDVVIGTAYGKSLMGLNSLRAKLESALEGGGLKKIGVDKKNYAASYAHTITSYTYRKLKIPAMQLEIRADWRDPESAPEKYEDLVSALCSAIKDIHTEVTKYR